MSFSSSLFQRLKLLRLNYKGRPIDDTVIDFFGLIFSNLTTLHLFEVRDLTLEDLRLTIGRCHVLETLVLNECSVSAEWRTSNTRVISRRFTFRHYFSANKTLFTYFSNNVLQSKTE